MHRHTQRKEIAQNLLGNMTINDMPNAGEMSFTDMMNDINDLKNESDDEDDDFKYAYPKFSFLESLSLTRC